MRSADGHQRLSPVECHVLNASAFAGFEFEPFVHRIVSPAALSRVASAVLVETGLSRPPAVGAIAYRLTSEGWFRCPTDPAMTREGRAACKLSKEEYAKHLRPLQEELNELAWWAKDQGQRILIIFEGCDTAGKGRAIRAISDVSTRACARFVHVADATALDL